MKSPTPYLLIGLLLLAGCASVPTGPSVMTLPGTGKTFDQFRFDDAECRHYALDQVGGSDAARAATDAGVRSAVVGTAVGAVVGAAIGGREGAAVGAGGGLMVGSVAGSGAAQSSAYGTQRRYDHAYIQCMYAKGHKVPVSESMMRSLPQAPAADASYPPPPPPPPGSPHPPPPTR